MKRILVCGGRDYTNHAMVDRVLRAVLKKHPQITIIHGDARGADRIAKAWAIRMRLPYESCPADWDTHKKAAGPIRNQQMLDTGIDAVVAFPGGNGTADMCSRAEAAGVPVWRIKKGPT